MRGRFERNGTLFVKYIYILLPSLNHKEFSVKEVHNKLCISDPQNDPANDYCLIDAGTGVTFELCSGAREFPFLLGFYLVLFCCWEVSVSVLDGLNFAVLFSVFASVGRALAMH